MLQIYTVNNNNYRGKCNNCKNHRHAHEITNILHTLCRIIIEIIIVIVKDERDDDKFKLDSPFG